MKKHRLWKMTALLALSMPAMLVSCTEENPDGTAGVPTVTIERVGVTSDAITFTLTATDADEVVYLVRATGGSMSVEDLMADGESLVYLEPVTRRYQQLVSERSYTVYAVALRSGEHGEMATLEMTTDALPPIEYDDELDVRSARLTYWGATGSAGIDEFTLSFSDAENAINDNGSFTRAPGSVNARLVLWTSSTDAANPELPEGSYSYNASGVPASGTIDSNASYIGIIDDSGMQSELSGFLAEDTAIEVTRDGDNYEITATIAFGAIMGDPTIYKMTWSGRIDTVIGEDEEDDRTVILDEDITDKQFVDAFAMYQDSYSGYDLVRLEFTDIESAFELESIPDLTYLSLDVYTSISADDRIEGTTFNVTPNAGMNVVRQGNFDGSQQSLARSFVVMTGSDGVISDADGIKSGTMTRTAAQDGSEIWTFDFITTHDHRITGTYEGTVQVLGYEQTFQSNLTGDYEFAWGSSIYANNLRNYGDAAGTGNTEWSIELWLESEDGTMDCFYADLYSEGTGSATLPAGTYSAAASQGEAWSFTPGTYDGYGAYTYWYRTAEDSYTEQLWAPFVGGTIEVSGGADGADYTFKFNLLDDAGHKITGSWTGPLE